MAGRRDSSCVRRVVGRSLPRVDPGGDDELFLGRPTVPALLAEDEHPTTATTTTPIRSLVPSYYWYILAWFLAPHHHKMTTMSRRWHPHASAIIIVPSLHHAALKTRNITTAIQFYGLLGYRLQQKFRAGPARAAWLELPCSSSDGSSNSTSTIGGGSSAAAAAGGRLELLEVPGYMLPPQNDSKPPPRAPNLMDRPALLGYNHVALDVTPQIRAWNRDRGNNGCHNKQ